MAIEEPSYSVVIREAPFEVREVHAYVVAQTFVEGTFESAGNEGFRRLFSYISGANRSSSKVTMTAPVEQEGASARIAMTAPVEQQATGSTWRIAFVLPAGYTLQDAPQPTDGKVQLAQVPARRVAVVRYSGTWGKSRYDEQLASLRAFLEAHHLAAAGEPVFDRYDPPFMPWFLRRNEIQIPLQAAAAPGGH